MGRPREPQRDAAYEIWANSNGTAKLKDIAKELGVPDSRIRKWKTVDKWDEKIKERSHSNKGAIQNTKGSAPKRGAPFGSKNALGHGAPKGNKNALGNKGGGPVGNKKAVKTGEYETIWFDCITEDERLLCAQINTDHKAQIEEEITLLTLRERRMLERIQKIVAGMNEKERKVLQELQVVKEAVWIKDPFTDENKSVILPTPKLVVTSVEEREYRKIDDILRIEEALTRIQDKKAKLLALCHTIDAAAGKGGEGNGAAKDGQFTILVTYDDVESAE